MVKHRYPKNNWDRAAKLEIYRDGQKLDPGVNFFVLMLNQIGLDTKFSCESHPERGRPDEFYVVFSGTYEQALNVFRAEFLQVDIVDDGLWAIRRSIDTDTDRIRTMRLGAASWESWFGPLDFDNVVLEA